MRKRRRLANKMTIMVCAVLIAVSAFFYAPMYVEASSAVVSGSSSGQLIGPGNLARFQLNTNSTDFSGSYSEYVRFVGDLNFAYSQSLATSVFSFSSSVDFNGSRYVLEQVRELDSAKLVTTYSKVFHLDIVVPSENLDSVSVFVTGSYYSGGNLSQFVNSSLNCTFSNISITNLSSSDSEDYQNGYNAGYSAGEQAGYGNGYSQGFTDGEASVDIDAIYDEAYQAGVDSVDTQSFYDAGYQAGYQVAYSDGYESGYDVGYQEAMDRIASWGADTSDYPKQMFSIDMGHTFSTNVTYSVPFSYRDSVKGSLSNVNLNPNHTYKFDVEIRPYNWDSADTITYEDEFYFCIGGIDYPLSYLSSGSRLTSLFVPGDRMSDSYYLVWSTIRASVDGTNNICRVVCPYTITLYDMGPSGDTQNHIANQTDQLTHGYDSSNGDSANSSLSTGLNEFETAENSLFATATTGMKDFTFFDFESVPAMLTAVTFITSIMGSWFEQAGAASGVGIVLSILFSVMLVSMVLGLYRLYQSAGHRAEARERHRERMEQWKRGK